MTDAQYRELAHRILVLERRLGGVAVSGGGAVPTTRQVISGAGLTGGGDLSADRTLAVGAGTGITVNADDVALSDMAEATLKGRAAGAGTGAPTDLTADQVSTILDTATDPFVRTSAAAAAYTDEQAQDAVGGILVDSATIDLTYADATPSITAIVIDASITPAKASTALKSACITLTVDGSGTVITTGQKGYIQIPWAMTITSWSLVADTPGDIVIDVWAETGAKPDDSDSITGGNEPELSTDDFVEGGSVSGWTTAIAANDWVGFNVDSVATVTRVTLQLIGVRT